MEHQFLNLFSRLSRKTIFQIVLILILLIIVVAYPLNAHLKTLYAKQFSQATYDRNGTRIALAPNDRGYYMEDIGTVPDNERDRNL